MNLNVSVPAIALFLVLFTSCVPTKKMNGWVGKEEYQLIEQWGPPERKASNGSNGEILIYSKQFYYYGTTYYKYYMFYEYANGVIYHWLIQSGSVPPQRLDVAVYLH